MKDLLVLLDSLLGSAAYFPIVLLGTGLFLTVYLKFPQVRFFRHAWHIVRGKYTNEDAEGDATPFQALATAMSGTVGTGNIGGVALAIYLGGPAALFWMWITAFFGMACKFVEVSLSHKYREKDAMGYIMGGPMFVMERRLNMKWLAVFFAVATVISSFGTGSLPQSNNIANGIEASFGFPPWVTGLVLSVVLGAVILGGIKRIVQVAARMVPTMAILYLLGALMVIATNTEHIIPSFISVFRDAFTGSAATGGFLGATFIYAFNRGVILELFSNEAGQGSAPIAHAAAKTDESVAEGVVSILGPFIDTIVICTVTALVILSSGVWSEKFQNDFQRFDTEVIAGTYSDRINQDREALSAYLSLGGSKSRVKLFTGQLNIVDGLMVSEDITILHNQSVAEAVRFYSDDELFTGEVQVEDGKIEGGYKLKGRSLIHSVDLTMAAFSRGAIGDYGRYIVAIGLVLFAFSTAVAWSYYGDRAMTYLFGVGSVVYYRLVYIIGFFAAAVTDTSLVWLFSAVGIAVMTLPNLLTMLLLSGEIKQDIASYWQRFYAAYPDERKP